MGFDEFAKYIATVGKNDFQEYDDEKPENEHGFLRGYRSKRFYRFSSRLFSDLINELQNNPNCSYGTYVNDLIKSGYIPDYLSVVAKEDKRFREGGFSLNIGGLREVCASRILNYFECPTIYETYLKVEDGNILNNSKNICCSVDFNNYGEDLNLVHGFMRNYDFGAGELETVIPTIEKIFERWKLEEDHREDYEDMKNKFIEDYVYSYMIRRFVLKDGDFWLNNVGIIFNKEDKTFRMAPNFDFEYCFDEFDGWYNIKSFLKNLKYIKEHYPKVYTKFITMFDKLVANNCEDFIHIMQENMGSSYKADKFICKHILHLNRLKNEKEEILQNEEPTM